VSLIIDAIITIKYQRRATITSNRSAEATTTTKLLTTTAQTLSLRSCTIYRNPDAMWMMAATFSIDLSLASPNGHSSSSSATKQPRRLGLAYQPSSEHVVYAALER
jgi:hypothetical protein